MVLSKTVAETDILHLTSTQKRRIRRKRLRVASIAPGPDEFNTVEQHCGEDIYNNILANNNNPTNPINLYFERHNFLELDSTSSITEMSDKEPSKSREKIMAARATKKSDKQNTKVKPGEVKNIVKKDIINKNYTQESKLSSQVEEEKSVNVKQTSSPTVKSKLELNITAESSRNVGVKHTSLSKSKDEVDRAYIELVTAEIGSGEKGKDQIKAERAAKKAAKQAKKKGLSEAIDTVKDSTVQSVQSSLKDVNEDMTVKEVVKTLKDIVEVAREMKEVTAKVEAINLESKKKENTDKSKAELRAERRAKQEAQRAAKQTTLQEKVATKPLHPSSTSEQRVKPAKDVSLEKEKSPKQKLVEKPKLKPPSGPANWFQHLNIENDKDVLNNIPLNSNLHPAIVKLGVQLATHVVSGSNARCIALLDALKKMVTDYTLPAKTEFARGLESHLATSLDFLWSMRQPSASQTNAVKYFRHHLTQLPNNVDEFDAKKRLQEEIDRYIREQIDMAGEAISMTVRKKITAGDYILTYECSSLIERILREAWAAGSQFRVCVCGRREARGGREMLRRLAATGLPCTYIDVTALSAIMKTVSKVLLGASSLLVNGSVLGAVGTAQVALVAREFNVPVLVACETHKFSERVQTDAFVYNELGDPDDLIDKSDDNSPLRDWRSNPNLTPLNLTYDVTPPSLVTAVVTELAILPCTSAPVVLRFKLSEYGI